MAASILALDQGTTSSRAILFDLEGQQLGLAQEEFPQHFPQPGWVEHDPEEIWESQIKVAREVLEQSGVTASSIAAIGLTNQRETTVLWDRASGQAVAPAIVWQDRRTADICQKLREEGREEWVRERTGLELDPYLAGTKLQWLLDQDPERRERAERGELAFGTVDSWLIWKLTGGRLHATDASNASRTLFFNLTTGDWDDELLELFHIPREVLPEIRDSSEVLATTDESWFGEAIPIAGVAGDQQAALFGQACQEPGEAKNTYGTGCFLLMQTGTKPVYSEQRLLTTVAWRLDGVLHYALEGSIFVAGAAVQWIRDQLGLIESAPEVEALAASVPDHGGVVMVPAFAGLGAPHWEPGARGTVFGLTRGSSSGHLARSTLNAIALQTWEVVEAMERDSGLELSSLRIDGGASKNDLLMQIQADVLGRAVVRPSQTETTALGAAYLAGLAVGVWDSPEQIRENWQADRTWEPEKDDEWREELRAEWKRAVEAVVGWSGG